eukprot:superscaffoldBa00002440_g14249
MSSTLPRHVIWESEGLVAYLHPRPWTPGSVILESSTPGRPGGSIFHLEEPEYLSWLLGARTVAELLCDRLGVRRCALVARPHRDRPAQEQQWRVWDDEGHVAFLTPFPNSPGFTVLVPRRPLTSDIFRLEKKDYEGLVLATRKVSRLLEEGLSAWGVGLIFEGFEIDYAHAKLIPLLSPSSSGGGDDKTKPRPPQFHPTYPGYVTSEDGPEASLDSLKEVHTKITV